MEIIKCQQNNLMDVLSLYTDNISSAWNKEMLSADFCNDNTKCFLLMGNDEVLGFFNALFTEDCVELLDIVSKSKGEGHGTYLLNYCKELAGTRPVFLEVSKNNPMALKFYLKNEFKIISERHHYYADGSDAIIMKFSQV